MVYVDDRDYEWGGVVLSVMVADGLAELRDVADHVGIPRFYEWHWPFPLYVVAQSKRALILSSRLARRCTAEQLDAMVTRRRLTGALGEPGDALDWISRVYLGRRI